MTNSCASSLQRKTFRVVILDPSPGLATGLAGLLHGPDGISAEGHAITARLEGLSLRTYAPDAVMIDPGEVTLPPQGLVPRLRDSFGAARIIGYVATDSPALARTCLTLGFRAFLSKSSTLETVRLCLTAVRAGALFVDPRHAGAIQAVPDTPPPTPLRGLTEREAYVLKSVARGKSLKEIGYELALSSKTVETYKARGTSKLNISGRREIVEYAIRAGWV